MPYRHRASRSSSSNSIRYRFNERNDNKPVIIININNCIDECNRGVEPVLDVVSFHNYTSVHNKTKPVRNSPIPINNNPKNMNKRKYICNRCRISNKNVEIVDFKNPLLNLANQINSVKPLVVHPYVQISPQYSPTSPAVVTEYPRFNPNSPKTPIYPKSYSLYTPSSPKYSPVSPQYEEKSPIYSLCTPTYPGISVKQEKTNYPIDYIQEYDEIPYCLD